MSKQTYTTISSNEMHTCEMYSALDRDNNRNNKAAKVRKMRRHNMHKLKNWVGVFFLPFLSFSFSCSSNLHDYFIRVDCNGITPKKNERKEGKTDCTAFQWISRKYMIAIITTNNSNSKPHKRWCAEYKCTREISKCLFRVWQKTRSNQQCQLWCQSGGGVALCTLLRYTHGVNFKSWRCE